MAKFANSQWAVTDYGLESVQPGAPYEYYIEAERLLEKAGPGGDYNWPRQIVMKTWVDADAFIEAYRKAIDIHADRYDGDVDRELLEESIQRAMDWKNAHRT